MAAIPGSLIPARPTEKDFLRSCSTLVVRDNSGVTADQVYLTTFQRDFRTSGQLPKCGALPRPTPAQMGHTDGRVLERGTEALCSYTPPRLQRISRIPAWAKLGTNLRMHGDRRQATRRSTQAEGYRPPPPHSASLLARPSAAIQLGSHDNRLPETTHRETFPAHATPRVVRAPVRHLGGEPTIRGDQQRALSFSTQHREAFQGRWCPPPALMEKQFRSSLAMGDPERQVERETTQAGSYRPPGAQRPVKVMERLKVNLGDNQNKWESTTADAYRSRRAECVHHRKLNRALSFVPRGDVDAERNRARTNDTTYRFFFSEGSHREVPTLVDGASLRTRSNVQFGRPSLGKMFYRTSSKEDYPRRDGTRAQPSTHPSGRVLSGLEPEPAVTTVQRDFRPSNGKRQELPPTQLKQIKESHINPPCEEHHFSTTHNEFFPSLPLARTPAVDPHRLQRSHVPL
ncbi:stabilizer of axonemal microtubules 5 [Sardina pilchardus]|uniref:stabilizer of axonemal microtubules 5 n=1 Tax=Sardina pilchardus TaxID=27697 RepID=UPI002E15BD7C